MMANVDRFVRGDRVYVTLEADGLTHAALGDAGYWDDHDFGSVWCWWQDKGSRSPVMYGDLARPGQPSFDDVTCLRCVAYVDDRHEWYGRYRVG